MNDEDKETPMTEKHSNKTKRTILKDSTAKQNITRKQTDCRPRKNKRTCRLNRHETLTNGKKGRNITNKRKRRTQKDRQQTNSREEWI